MRKYLRLRIWRVYLSVLAVAIGFLTTLRRHTGVAALNPDPGSYESQGVRAGSGSIAGFWELPVEGSQADLEGLGGLVLVAVGMGEDLLQVFLLLGP